MPVIGWYLRPGVTADGLAALGGKCRAAEWFLGRPRSVLDSCEAARPTGHNLKLPGPPTSRRSDAEKPEVETNPVETNWCSLKLHGPRSLAGAMLKSLRSVREPLETNCDKLSVFLARYRPRTLAFGDPYIMIALCSPSFAAI